MEKLKELITKLCPNGVEFKKIEEFTSFEQPTKYIVKSTKYSDEYKVPVLTAGQTFVLGYTNEEDGIYNASKENPVIIFDDFTGAYKWVDFPFKVKSSAMKIITTNEDKLLIRFLYYMMGFLNYTSNEHKRLWISVYSQMKIAIPPLEVQSEIVNHLDKYSLLNEKLSNELSSELIARKKQFEHYKDELYGFENKNVEYVKLKDIAEVIRGGNFQKRDFVESGKPCIHYGQIYTKYGSNANETFSFISEENFNKSKQAQPNDIIMAVTSENVEDVCKCVVWCGNENVAVSGHTAIVHHNINSKYLGYYFSTSHFYKTKTKLVHGTKVMEVTPSSLNEILIPVPKLEEQNKIADLIEKYEKIYNAIVIEIPKEIEKNQKQYEYYRDKLLSFKEVEVNE